MCKIGEDGTNFDSIEDGINFDSTAQLNEVLAASNLDPVMLGNITRKLDEVLDAKNKAIKDLQVLSLRHDKKKKKKKGC